MSKYIVNLIHPIIAESIKEITSVYELENLAMCIVDVNEVEIDKIRKLDGVISVMLDKQETLDYLETPVNAIETELWGKARISNTVSNAVWRSQYTGLGVDIYLIDSGVNIWHDDFVKSASYDNPPREDITSLGLHSEYGVYGLGYQLAPANNSRADCLSAHIQDLSVQMPVPGYLYIGAFPLGEWHGTAVASCAAGNTYGLACNARILSLSTLITRAEILDALDTILGHHAIKIATGVARPSVVNISIKVSGFVEGELATWDTALNLLMDAGIILVASVGNDYIDVPLSGTDRRPSSLADIVSVAATDILDNLAYFSNYGSSVLVSAPGLKVKTANMSYVWNPSLRPLSKLQDPSYLYGLRADTKSSSGTSFSSPYTAGLIACVLEGLGCPVFTTRAEIQWFIQYFLAYYTAEWVATKHYIEDNATNILDPTKWLDGFPADDSGTAHKILFNNYEQVYSGRLLKNGQTLVASADVTEDLEVIEKSSTAYWTYGGRNWKIQTDADDVVTFDKDGTREHTFTVAGESYKIVTNIGLIKVELKPALQGHNARLRITKNIKSM